MKVALQEVRESYYRKIQEGKVGWILIWLWVSPGDEDLTPKGRDFIAAFYYCCPLLPRLRRLSDTHHPRDLCPSPKPLPPSRYPRRPRAQRFPSRVWSRRNFPNAPR